MMRQALIFAFALFAAMPASAESSFQAWLDEVPGRRSQATAFERYLESQKVDGIVGTDDLLRNASSWKSCGLKYPWSMPPRPLWSHVVPALRFIRDEVIPAVGPVRVESGWREPSLNRCSGGAPKSAHALYYALDLIPLRPVTRRDLIATVCRIHAKDGRKNNIGLGFYEGVRFHIDAKLFRRWGSDNHGKTSPCAAIGY